MLAFGTSTTPHVGFKILTASRLILYFPVSALVTLFANILQNPQDARARQDIKLMNQVVNFLSMLSSDEENGGVRRMLGVCSEFERIAKVVLDKADKDSHSRRKRKNNDAKEDPKPRQASVQPHPVTQLTPGSISTPASAFTPNFSQDGVSQPFNPSVNGFSPPTNGDMPLLPDYNAGEFSSMLTPSTALAPGFMEMQQFSNSAGSPLNMGSFQQPFVPQDLWQMPMTLEWDWADMTAVTYPLFDMADPQQQPPGGQL